MGPPKLKNLEPKPVHHKLSYQSETPKTHVSMQGLFSLCPKHSRDTSLASKPEGDAKQFGRVYVPESFGMRLDKVYDKEF